MTVMLVLCAVVALNVWLFVAVPKGFFPQQDSGQLNGGMRADQSISFDQMQAKLRQLVDIIRADPAVDTVVGFTGGSRAGGGFMFVNLKPKGQRKDGGQAVIARLRPQLAKVTGISLFLNPVQDLRMGGRQSNSTYQYTLKSDNQADLAKWATRLADAMKNEEALTDIDTDQQENGVESFVTIDRDAAARQGMTNKDVDNALYDAFGQRQVATIYDALNQYHVVMEAMPKFTQTPASLKDVRVPGNGSNAAAAAGAASAAYRGHDGHGQRQPGLARRVHRRDRQHQRAHDGPAVDRSPRSARTRRAPASTTRTASWPRRCRTTWPRATRCRTPRPPSSTRRRPSTCRSTCAAACRAPRPRRSRTRASSRC